MTWQNDGDPTITPFEPRPLIVSVLDNARRHREVAARATADARRMERLYRRLTVAHAYLYAGAFAAGLLLGLLLGYAMGGGR